MGNPSVHVEQELLLRYAMMTAAIVGVSKEEKLALEDVRYIERHLKSCATCRNQVERLEKTAKTGDRLLEKVVARHLGAEALPGGVKRVAFKKVGLVLLPTAAVALLVVLSPKFFPMSLSSPWVRQAVLHDEVHESFTVTRGSAISEGAAYFADGLYDEAITSFRETLATPRDSAFHGLALLSMGLTYLQMAEQKKFFLFYEFDQEHADSALVHFAACLQSKHTLPRMRATALFFSAKAHLMRNELHAACQALQACIELGREKSAEARKLRTQLREDC